VGAAEAMTPDEIEQWPEMRGRALRVILRGVLLKGPLFGLGITAMVVSVTALLLHQQAGETLDFGWFQIPGQVGAPVFPVLFHFGNFLPWAVIVSSLFLILVGAGIWVTCETQFRRQTKSAEKDGDL
jgi:hypothetical protein